MASDKTLRGRTQNNTQRGARGRQKKVEVDEIQNKAPKVEEDLDNKSGEIEGDVEVEEESKFLRKKTQNTNRRSTRGRQKNVEDSQNVEPEADEAQNHENDYAEGDVEVGEDLSNSNKDKKQSVGEEELADSVAVGACISEAEKKGKRRAKSLPVTSKQRSQKSTRKLKKGDENAVVASDEELLRGGKKAEDGAAKLSGSKTRAQRKKEAKQSKEDGNREERRGDADGDVEDGSADVELSERKTRGQRRKEAVAKLNIEDGDGEEREEETEEAVVDSKIEDAVYIDGEEMALENKGKGEEDSNHKVVVQGVKTQELDTTVQRKGRAGKTKDKNEIENDGKFGEVANKRRGRKSLRDQKTGQSEGQRLIEEAEVSLKARKGKKGKGKETTKVSPDGGQKDVLDIVGELDEELMLSNRTVRESVSNSSSASSIVSSGSESKKKAGTKRRKQSSVLPPYALRGSKSKNLKISATMNSHDSTTESELRTDAKKPRLEEERNKSNIAGETSRKGGAIGSGKGGRAVRTGRRSAGGKKPVAQRNKSEVTHDKSVSSAAHNNDEDDHADVFGDSDEVHGEGDGNFSVQEADGVEDRSFEEVPSEGITPTPFLKPAAKSATALKSILKSGGSVGRANTGT